jgi:tRNA1Val (adenine37-N6)-methyltransferase
MALGTDSVMLGAWANIPQNGRILDIGTGCGILALMCAQRSNQGVILGIDISEEAIKEAMTNGDNSAWNDRLIWKCLKLQAFKTELLDYIICNPPYYEKTGLQSPQIARRNARHTNELELDDILRFAQAHLKQYGLIGLVIPIQLKDKLEKQAIRFGFATHRILEIRPTENKKANRILIEMGKEIMDLNQTEIVIRNIDGSYTKDYLHLTEDFYL